MSDHSHAHAHTDSEQVGVESDSDIHVGLIAASGAFFVVVLLAIFLVLHSLFIVVLEEAMLEKHGSVVDARLVELKTKAAEQLGNYKVLDKEKGVYQIPIDQAMALTVSKMSANAPKAAPEAPVAPEGAAPVTAPEGAAPAGGEAVAPATGEVAAPAGGEAPAGGAH